MLEMLAKAAVASQFPGFSRWAFGQQHEHAANATRRPHGELPALVLLPLRIPHHRHSHRPIIPQTKAPALKRQASASSSTSWPPMVKRKFSSPCVTASSGSNRPRRKLRRNFAELSPEQQTEILKRVAYRDIAVRGHREGRTFFRLIRRYTVMGYYTSRVGLGSWIILA